MLFPSAARCKFVTGSRARSSSREARARSARAPFARWATPAAPPSPRSERRRQDAMVQNQPSRETPSRDIEGSSTLASRPRGRTPAPRVFNWLPLAAKVGVAAGGIAALAIIGANAGAHSPASSDGPALSSSGPAPLSPAVVPAPPPPPPASSPPDDGSAGSAGGLLDDGRVVLN